MLPGMGHNLDTFIAKWAAAGAAERANKDMFLTELCGVLGVAPPNPAMGDAERDTYVFEREARLSHEGGEATIGRIDLYKQGCFILEAKQASGEGSSKLGKGLGARPSNRRGLEERAQTREMCGPELKLAGAESSGVTIAAWSECSPSLKIFPSQPVR